MRSIATMAMACSSTATGRIYSTPMPASIFDYLSQFTAWHAYEHRVLAEVDGQLVPIPINLDTVNTLYGLNLDGIALQALVRGAGRNRRGDPDIGGCRRQQGRARSL